MNIEIFDVEQGTREWFLARAGLPTASCFDKVMAQPRKGSSESKTRNDYLYQLADEVIYGDPVESYTNADMERGKAMEAEACSIYALEQEGRYNGTLTGKDLHVESPYNTYMHGGLPPGPIGNPGIISLRAALAPADTPFLYFVANTQGGHFFSSTLAEHNDNVIRYHRLLAGQPADPPPAETQASSKSQGKKHKGSGR